MTLCVYIYLDVSKSVEYSQKTMDEALQKVKAMRADLGGTEILQPLKHIYSQPCLPDQPRQVTYTPYINKHPIDKCVCTFCNDGSIEKLMHYFTVGYTVTVG